MAVSLRLARPDDASAVLAIYGPIVVSSPATFEVVVPSEAEVRRRIEDTLANWPWVVCEEEEGALHGYAYAARHRERWAYQWSADVSVYVAPQAHRRGVGRALYTAVFDILRLQGYCNAYAGITLPNAASVGLHEALGFSHLGVYRRVGYKLGEWHDVGWWHRPIRPLPEAPEPPSPMSMLAATAEVAGCLDRARALVRG